MNIIELLEERKDRVITIFVENGMYYGIYKGHIGNRLIIEPKSIFEDEEEIEYTELIEVSIDNIIEIC